MDRRIDWSFDAEHGTYIFRVDNEHGLISSVGNLDWDMLPSEVRAKIRHDLDGRLDIVKLAPDMF